MMKSRLLCSGLLALVLGAWQPLALPQDKKDASKQTITKDQAARKYRDGLAFEKAGNERAALGAFQEAAEGGHGLAQRRLAIIYDRGNSATPRDYQQAIHWYEKARDQGIELPKPIPPIKGR
jgi:TPR repeat protein